MIVYVYADNAVFTKRIVYILLAVMNYALNVANLVVMADVSKEIFLIAIFVIAWQLSAIVDNIPSVRYAVN